MNGKNRKDIIPGIKVKVVQKQDQRTGTIAQNQITGMLLIEKHLSRVKPVSIAIYNLVPD